MKIKYHLLIMFVTSALMLTSCMPQSPTPNPAATSYRLEPAYPNLTFNQPLYFAVSGNGSGDAFVVERAGKIQVFADQADVNAAEVFLDLSNVVVASGQEQGLLGLAFHPAYAQNGYFYVNYTNREGTVIARYTRQNGNSRAADPDSGQVLLTFAQPFTNHNGGHLAFGLDGYLYIATGDGGSGGDPQNNAQDRTNLLGKILRIDVDQASSCAPYSVPADNPFIRNSLDFRTEIYAYGLRNPWRFSFDSRGALWAADVGQSVQEEINLIEKGGNYGWSVLEGTADYKTIADVIKSSLIAPVWVYDREQGKSITGGYVYGGKSLPNLKGTYVYGDFVTGRIWGLRIDADRKAHNSLILDTDLSIASFGIDVNQELRIVDLKGKIYRLME